MKIQVDGTNTLNKGAELMLYAVLEEIEPKYPNAKIIYNSFGKGYKEINTSLKISGDLRLSYGFYPGIILSKLKLPYQYFTNFYPKKDIDILLDASGFRLGDQWNRNKQYIKTLELYYKALKANGTKIILLPQALGPFSTVVGKETARVLNEYADLIIARESYSHKYLIEANVNPDKVIVSPDFTNLVKGVLPTQYDSISGKVCIIPNKKMLTHTSFGKGKYLELIQNVIQTVIESGHGVFILNHEGAGDMEICNSINAMFNNELQIITNLTAKEVKGVIGASYFTFSSRYHGVASALSQVVPCLATSWSHKYQLLFKDYGLENQVIDLDSSQGDVQSRIKNYLDANNNKSMRDAIRERKGALENTSRAMWNQVWKVANQS